MPSKPDTLRITVDKTWSKLRPNISGPEHDSYYDVLDAMDIAIAILTPSQRKKLVRLFTKFKTRRYVVGVQPDVLDYVKLTNEARRAKTKAKGAEFGVFN